MNRPNISGIHHITAITASARENLAFYETTLGLRLVKQTVNFDDPSTYHLYYGDALGTPGTILTFFPWENLPQGKPGSGMATAIAFAVPKDSMDFWQRRMTAAGVRIVTIERFGEPVICFADPHGLPLELIGVSRPPAALHWQAGTVPKAHAISGFHSATATLTALEPIAFLLKDVMGMTFSGQEQNRYRFNMADPEAPGHYYDVIFDPQARSGRTGSGTVHHIAFRTENDATQVDWQSILKGSGLGVTDVRDRQYFRSIYFHSPGGVLFEMATDSPGFSIDETPADLGTSLKLPPQYEPSRAAIEKRLPPLRVEMFHHIFREAPCNVDDGRSLVILHGTGGNEYDLLKLAEEVSPAAAIIGVRGRVSENGRARFFKRLGDNVFDEQDVIDRAHELSDFLLAAAPRYGRNGDRLTALGYSNGANMAAAMILLRPEVFAQAVLIRPMLPLQNPSLPDLLGKKILVLRGSRDTIIPPESTDRLVESLQSTGAELTVRIIDAGHEITADDLREITRWISAQRPDNPVSLDEASMAERA